jgi:hypothetical protein
MLDGSISGSMMTDQICLDKGEDTCLEDFDFLSADDISYPIFNDVEIGGVISFNQYQVKNHPSYRLVYDLYVEDVFFQKTLQLDLRLATV